MNIIEKEAVLSAKLYNTAQMIYKHLCQCNACASNKSLANIRLTHSKAHLVERFINNSLGPVAELPKLQGRTDAQHCSTVEGA